MSSVKEPVTKREESKQAKLIDDARKAGVIPAAVDEDGNDINPHIPQYISKAPWYISQGKLPSLKHQRYVADDTEKNIWSWYKRGSKLYKPTEADGVSTKIRWTEGSCQNCGSGTHHRRDCTERPRKRLAAFTNADLRPDEMQTDMGVLDYDSKRDRWAGFDPREYKAIIKDFEEVERIRHENRLQSLESKLGLEETKPVESKKEKRRSQVEKLKNDKDDNYKKSRGGNDGETDTESDTDSDTSSAGSIIDEETADTYIVKDFSIDSVPATSHDDRTRTHSRNLRIREDTAKYLLNLDVNSAFYDPKSRSMRADPFQGMRNDLPTSKIAIGQNFAGENAWIVSDDTKTTSKLELFAWETYKRGGNTHHVAHPTQLDKLYSEHLKKKDRLIHQANKELHDLYGNQTNYTPDIDVILGQSEVPSLYSSDGTLIKPNVQIVQKSIYEEDNYPANHKSIFGSFYDRKEGKWGFSCCKQLDSIVTCSLTK